MYARFQDIIALQLLRTLRRGTTNDRLVLRLITRVMGVLQVLCRSAVAVESDGLVAGQPCSQHLLFLVHQLLCRTLTEAPVG